MEKKVYIRIILLSVFLSLAVNVFFGRVILSHIASWPVLNKFEILNSQAPIIIHKKEIVRENFGNDFSVAFEIAKDRTSSLMYVEKNQIVFLGSALNFSNDGVFLTSVKNLEKWQNGSLYVVLSDGRKAEVRQVKKNFLLNLASLKADVANVPVANFGNSAELRVMEQVIALYNSDNWRILASRAFVGNEEKYQASVTYNSDVPVNSFELVDLNDSENFTSLFNSKGQLVGIGLSGKVLGSNALNFYKNSFFEFNKDIQSPSLGFSYKFVSELETSILKKTPGLQIVSLDTKSTAALGGLKIGDVVTQINDKLYSLKNPPDELFGNLKPGAVLRLKIERQKQIVDLEILVK